MDALGARRCLGSVRDGPASGKIQAPAVRTCQSKEMRRTALTRESDREAGHRAEYVLQRTGRETVRTMLARACLGASRAGGRSVSNLRGLLCLRFANLVAGSTHSYSMLGESMTNFAVLIWQFRKRSSPPGTVLTRSGSTSYGTA